MPVFPKREHGRCKSRISSSRCAVACYQLCCKINVCNESRVSVRRPASWSSPMRIKSIHHSSIYLMCRRATTNSCYSRAVSAATLSATLSSFAPDSQQLCSIAVAFVGVKLNAFGIFGALASICRVATIALRCSCVGCRGVVHLAGCGALLSTMLV